MVRRRRWFPLALFLLLAVAALFALIHLSVHNYDYRILTETEYLNIEHWPRPRVAIVFGASVFSSGDLSPALEDRCDTAIELYKAKKVDRILVSGDNRDPSYNEPKAMRDYLVSHAVGPKDVIVDYGGRSTYETCWRAREIFGLERAVLVTQGYHLPRALYLANELGLDAVGVATDTRAKTELDYPRVREWGAEIKAFFNLHVSPPDVLRGERLPIR